MELKHLIEPSDFTVAETEALLTKAGEIEGSPAKYRSAGSGKIISTLFFEPSTRTRLSFESAMLSLGGSVIGFSSADMSSAAKGESVADTIRTVSCYSDICAMRHPKEGSAKVAATFATIPVINAGDGGHEHPTQTLTDLFTILKCKGGLTGLKIGVCGDLKFGRTVHSLLKAMTRHGKNEYFLVSPPELKAPSYITEDVLKKSRSPFAEVVSLTDCIGEMDILYMTRVQRERFFNEEDYVRLKDTYILDKQKLKAAKSDLAILHPLPRVNEISTEVDSDPRAVYFKQVRNGKYVRMALIMYLLGLQEGNV